MHGCSSLPSATDGIPRPQLPRRLAHSGPVRGSFNIAQEPLPQPLMLPGAQGQLCQEHTVTQPMSIVPEHSYRLSADDSNCLSGASHDDSEPRGFLQGRERPSTQSFPENAGPYDSSYASTSVGSALHATHPVLAEAEGSICSLASWTHRLTVTRVCVSALALCTDLLWLKQGVILDTTHRRKVVMTDTSKKCWGALCEGKPTFGLWSEEESGLHINCLEMLAVCHACQLFLLGIRGHHELVSYFTRAASSRSASACWQKIFLFGLRPICAH